MYVDQVLGLDVAAGPATSACHSHLWDQVFFNSVRLFQQAWKAIVFCIQSQGGLGNSCSSPLVSCHDSKIVLLAEAKHSQPLSFNWCGLITILWTCFSVHVSLAPNGIKPSADQEAQKERNQPRNKKGREALKQPGCVKRSSRLLSRVQLVVVFFQASKA